MAIILDPFTIPEKGKVELKIDRSFEINITADEAQRRVRGWLRDEVSLLMTADSPTLAIGQHVVWRVPAWISFPHTGRAGLVGAIDVDVTTGAMNNTLERKAEIEHKAEAIAAVQPAFHLHELPTQFLAQHIPPAPKLSILDDGTLAAVSPNEIIQP